MVFKNCPCGIFKERLDIWNSVSDNSVAMKNDTIAEVTVWYSAGESDVYLRSAESVTIPTIGSFAPDGRRVVRVDIRDANHMAMLRELDAAMSDKLAKIAKSLGPVRRRGIFGRVFGGAR